MDPAAILAVYVKAQGATATSANLLKVQATAEKADKSMRKLETSSDRFDKQNRRTNKGLDDTTHHLLKFNQSLTAAGHAIALLKFPAMVAGAGLAASAIGGLAAGVIGLTSALAPLAGLLPAAASGFVAMGQGMGVVKLAFANVTQAMKGNTAALGKLTPAQKTFVDQLKAMKGHFDDLKNTAAQGLFPGLNQALKNLTPLFGPLKQVIGDTGKALGDVAAKAGKSIGGWGKDLKSIGENNVKVIGHLGNAAISLANAFKDILVAAEPLTLWLAKLADKGAKNIESMVGAARKSGELTKFFDKTKKVATEVGHIFANLAVVLFQVFKAAAPLGNSLLKTLDTASKRWANWSKSIKGQNALKKWFADMKAPLMATLHLFADLGKAFIKITDQPGSAKMIDGLRKMVPLLQQFVTSTTQAFGPALIQALQQLVRLFVIFAGASGPLVIAVKLIGQVAGAIADLLDKGGKPLKDFLATVFGLAGAFKLAEIAISPFKAKWVSVTSLFGKLGGQAKAAGAAQQAAGTEAATAAGKAIVPVNDLAAAWDRVATAAGRAAGAAEAAAGVAPGGKLGGVAKAEATAGGVILPPGVSSKAIATEVAAEESAVAAATRSRFEKFSGGLQSRFASLTSKVSTVAENAGRGVGVALGGILATQISSQLVGGNAGKWISAIGTGASAGAGIGSLFGPEGAIGGAIIGAIGGSLVKALGIGGGESKAEKAARAYAKGFGEDMANAVSTGLPKGLDKAQEKTLAQGFARAQRLRQNAHQAAQQAAQQATQQPQVLTGRSGPGATFSPQTPPWLSGYLKGAAQRQDIKNGMKVAQDWMKGFASVKYKDAGTFVASASASIANLPKFARGEAGMMITQFAEQLIAKKQLPPKALKQVFDGMLSNVPGLRKAFAQQGILTDQDLARSFKLQKARSTLQDSMNWIQHTFGNVVGTTKVDGDNMAGGFEKATRALKQAAARNVGAAHDLAIDKLHDVQKQGSRYAAMLATQVGSSTSHMRNQIKKNVGGAADDATFSFATMFGQIGGMIQAGTVTMNKGVTLIANALNAQLTAFGAAKIPLPVLKTLSLKGLVGEQQFALHGAAGTGSGPGMRGARGALMQIGQAGQAGSDSVPLNVGGTPITVAPGEQVAVFNRHQLPVVNSALSMAGYAGLPGLFSQIQTPNYMAKGGMVGSKGLKMASGGTFSYGQLEGLWIKAGGPKALAPTAAAIAEAESHGSAVAHNASGATGLWQILGNPFPGNAYDPLTNARMAVSKWRSANGFSPWVTYVDGAYRAYMHGNVPAIGGAGAVPTIKAPHVGGKGTMSKIVQAGLNKATRAANAKLRREAAKFAPAGGVSTAGVTGAGGLGTFDGLQVANWIIPILNWAQGHGWGGRITSGYRPGAITSSGNISNHASFNYPGGAVDVGDQTAITQGEALWNVVKRYPGSPKLYSAAFGPGAWGPYTGSSGLTTAHDYGHFSATGHARGGLVGRARGFARGGLVSRGRGFAGGGFAGGARSFTRGLPRAGTAVRAVAAAAPIATAAAAPSGSSGGPSKSVPNPVIPKIPNALTVLSIPQKMTADVKHVQHLMRDAEITGELITQAQVVHDALQPFGADQSYTSGFITTDAHGVSSADLPAAALETTYLLQQKSWWNQIVSDYKQALHLIHSLIKRIKTLRKERRKQIAFMRNRIRDNIQAVRGYTRNLTHIQAAEKKLKPKQRTAAAKQKIVDKFGKIAPDVLTATISALGVQNKAFGKFIGKAQGESNKLSSWLGAFYGAGQGGGDVEAILGKIGYAAFLKNGAVPASSVAGKTGIFGQVPTVGGDLANALLQATLSQDQANQITPAALGDAAKKANAALFSQQAATTATPSFDISRLAVAQASLAALSPSSFLAYAGAFARGGVVGAPFALVGENGPELAQLPVGTRVHPSNGAAGAAQTIHVHIHDGAVDASKIQVLAEHAANVVIRREVRSSMLPTPGRGGLGIR